MAIKLHKSFAVHPGKWLRAEIVEPAGLNVTDLADRLGVSRQSMSKLLNGHQGLSVEMAIRFEKAFGLSAATLMRMQSAHELAEAREREDEFPGIFRNLLCPRNLAMAITYASGTSWVRGFRQYQESLAIFVPTIADTRPHQGTTVSRSENGNPNSDFSRSW